MWPATPPATTRPDVPQLHGQRLQFGFVVNSEQPGLANKPPGGVGQSRSYFLAIEAFGMTIGGSPFELAPGAASQLFLFNDVRGNPAQADARPGRAERPRVPQLSDPRRRRARLLAV